MHIFTLDDYFLYLKNIYVYTEYTGLINYRIYRIDKLLTD